MDILDVSFLPRSTVSDTMLNFWVVAAVVGGVVCKPEAGYNYPLPITNDLYHGNTYISTGSHSSNQYTYNEGFHRSAGSQVPLIHKHIYVHVPPPDTEVPQTQRVEPTPLPQKHYKIVFIKAPSPPTPTAPIIPAIAQNQEKTLIYVLVKRPEEASEITIPTATPTQPSKPEVYFIKYKTQKVVSPIPPRADTGPLAGKPKETPPPNSRLPNPSTSKSSYVVPSISYGPPGYSGPY